MKKLAVIITHPIQYYAPVFKLLTERKKIKVKVFYTWEKGGAAFDEGFGKEVEWDLPLLDGYEYEFVSNNGNKKRRFWDLKNPSLLKSIESWGANAILIFGWKYFSHLKAMRYFKGKIPVFFRGDSTLLDEKRGIRFLVRRIWLTWLYKSIDIALYVGQNNKAYYLRHGVKEHHLFFAPHAIDNGRFERGVSHEKLIALKKELNFEEETVLFVFAGKLEEKKNPLLLIEAVKQLKGYNISLLIVGNGHLEKEVKEEISSDSRIKHLPFQNQTVMPVVYRLADVFVLPSKGPGETWGLAVNEAMACGKPVIVSDKVGCAIDLVQEGKTGYVFASANVEQLKDKLLLCLDSEKRKEMANIAKQYISHWSFNNQVLAIEQSVTATELKCKKEF